MMMNLSDSWGGACDEDDFSRHVLLGEELEEGKDEPEKEEKR